MGVRKKKKPGNPSREAGGSLPGQPGLQSRTAKDSQGYIEKSSLKKIERERQRHRERGVYFISSELESAGRLLNRDLNEVKV